MKSNIRNALSIPETSIIVEGAHRSIEYVGSNWWYLDFARKIRDIDYSIYRLVSCIINPVRYPQGRSYEYWLSLSERRIIRRFDQW